MNAIFEETLCRAKRDWSIPRLARTLHVVLDAKALGLSTPKAGAELRCVLRGTVHFLADCVKAVFGFTAELNGEVQGFLDVTPDLSKPEMRAMLVPQQVAYSATSGVSHLVRKSFQFGVECVWSER
jgi:hypothetical protein